MNLNKVMLAGNLTRDPELKYTQAQMAVATFGLAINRKWKDKSGQAKEEACFVDCTAWGATAENVQKYLKKGMPLFVEGRLHFSSWDGPDGKKRSKLDVTVDYMQFLGHKDAAPAGAAPKGNPAAKAEQTSTDDFADGDDGNTIPF